MDPGRDQRAESTHQAIFYAYAAYLVGSQGVQISQQQQWLTSGASNQVPYHANPWMQHPVYATAGGNPMHGNAEDTAMPTSFFGSYNTFHSKELSLYTNLGEDTSKGKSNQMFPALQHPVNTMSHDGPVLYMQLVLAAEQEEFSCICGKFQKDGIVCSHVLRVLSHLNMSTLPEKYYIYRWRRKNTKDIRDIRFNVPLELTAGSQHLRYTLLSNGFNKKASDGASTNRKYLYVVGESERVQQRLDEMTKEHIKNTMLKS